MSEAIRPLTLQVMARSLRVSSRWLKEEAMSGRIPHLKAGSKFLFHPVAVEQAILE
jgi:hypothetical protein